MHERVSRESGNREHGKWCAEKAVRNLARELLPSALTDSVTCGHNAVMWLPLFVPLAVWACWTTFGQSLRDLRRRGDIAYIGVVQAAPGFGQKQALDRKSVV